MTEKQFNYVASDGFKEFSVENAISELRVLLMDETQGIIPQTLRKNFNEEYKDFDTITAWDCLVDEINRINMVCDLHDFLVDNLEEIKKIDLEQKQ